MNTNPSNEVDLGGLDTPELQDKSVVAKSLPPVLDVCCGGRMFWFDKHDPRTLYLDHRRTEPRLMSNGATFSVQPDMVMDFRQLDLPDNHFSLVVFDPPHVLNAGDKSFLAHKYGYLKKDSWQEDIRRGFSECFRVLKPSGTLVFKWNEMHIPTKEVLGLTPVRPLFGHISGKASKTQWLVFIKADTAGNDLPTEDDHSEVSGDLEAQS